MHINIAEADLSHALLLLAIVGYALAMLAYAADFAFGRQRLAGPASAAASRGGRGARRGRGPAGRGRRGPRQRHSIWRPAGRPCPGQPARPAAPVPAQTRRAAAGRRARRWERIGLTLAIAGLVAHVTAILLRGIAEHRVPWGNMYEFIVAISAHGGDRHGGRDPPVTGPTTSACSCWPRWCSRSAWPSR